MYNHLLPHNKSEWNYLILDHKKSNTFLELFLIKKSKAQNMIYTTSGAVKYVVKIVCMYIIHRNPHSILNRVDYSLCASRNMFDQQKNKYEYEEIQRAPPICV